jgi:hypothetical protein
MTSQVAELVSIDSSFAKLSTIATNFSLNQEIRHEPKMKQNHEVFFLPPAFLA